MINGVSPVSSPTVISCSSNENLLTTLLIDLDKYFEKSPVIIILQDNIRANVINHLRKNKQKFAEGGSFKILSEIRNWDYGVLLLNSDEGRGVDTRFKKNSIVLIAVPINNYHEVQQMMGRSSRSRGIC